MWNRFKVPRACLYIPPPPSSSFDEVLDVREHYQYARFTDELIQEGIEVSDLTEGDEIGDAFLLYHTLGANASPMPRIKDQFSLTQTQRIVPLQTSVAGAMESILVSGALLAIEGGGYGRWLRGDQTNDQPSGIVTTAATARDLGLTVLETFREAAFIAPTRPLPQLLADILRKHEERLEG